MGHSRRPGLRKAGLCLLILFVVSACDAFQAGPYVTSYSSTLAQELAGTPKLCIVSYAVDPLLYDSSANEQDTLPGPAPLSLARREAQRAEAKKIATAVAAQHLEQMVLQLPPRFDLVGATGPEIIAYEPVTGTQVLAEAIAGCGSELGLTVHHRYGWDWDPENTGPQDYYFRTCMQILSAQGEAIWRFCGKGAMMLPAKLSLKVLMAGVAGVAPPMDEILHQYAKEAEFFPRLALGLMEEDAAGKPHSAGIEAYVTGDKATRHVVIDNAGDRKHVPNW